MLFLGYDPSALPLSQPAVEWRVKESNLRYFACEVSLYGNSVKVTVGDGIQIVKPNQMRTTAPELEIENPACFPSRRKR